MNTTIIHHVLLLFSLLMPFAAFSQLDSIPEKKVLTVILEYIQEDDSAPPEITLLDVIIRPGFLKSGSRQFNIPREEMLKCAFLNDNQQTLEYLKGLKL